MSDRAVMRILMFAYFYPPLGGAGVQRSLKFSKYLPDFGIVPSVISADSSAYTQDSSLLSEVPAKIEVMRLPHTPVLTRLMALAPRRDRARRVSAVPTPSRLDKTDSASRWRDRALRAFGTLQYPDDKTAWARHAEQAALRLMEHTSIDLVYSSSPPVSAHLAAMRVARHARVPWVADFRDLWTANPAYAAPGWRRAIDRRLESRLLAAASGIVTVSERLAATLADRTGPNVPVMSIPNGYDEADFAGVVVPTHASRGFCIVHAGTFYGHQSPDSFLRGVETLFEREPKMRERLRIRFVGSVGSRFEPQLLAFEARYPRVLERTGYVDHRQALAEMLAADALLLVIGGQAEAAVGVMTGKLFEYLRAARPILLLGAVDGEAAQLLRTVGAGAALDHAEPARIAELLSNWMAGGAPVPVAERAIAYERRALAGRLGAFLATVHDRFHGRD
ncbi:glycosyltransferase [Variovorax sp. V59]